MAENEHGEVVRGAVRGLRRWLRSQPHLIGVPDTDNFLLRFLRHQKFRTEDARAALDRYVLARSAHPEWFAGLDINADLGVRRLLASPYLLALPGKDASGRRVLFSRAAAMFGEGGDDDEVTARDVMRAHLLAYEALLCDETVQVS